MNNPINSFHISNAQLHGMLDSFSKIFPKNEAWDTFKILIESLKFALLNGENPERLSKRIRRERYRRKPSLLPLSPLQAKADIAEVKRLRMLAKEKPSIAGAQKLDHYRQEIMMLRQQGASQIDIKHWLLASKGVSVSQPTIHRYLHHIISDEQKT